MDLRSSPWLLEGSCSPWNVMVGLGDLDPRWFGFLFGIPVDERDWDFLRYLKVAQTSNLPFVDPRRIHWEKNIAKKIVP